VRSRSGEDHYKRIEIAFILRGVLIARALARGKYFSLTFRVGSTVVRPAIALTRALHRLPSISARVRDYARFISITRRHRSADTPTLAFTDFLILSPKICDFCVWAGRQAFGACAPCKQQHSECDTSHRPPPMADELLFNLIPISSIALIGPMLA
jgi:hypothetical protein